VPALLTTTTNLKELKKVKTTDHHHDEAAHPTGLRCEPAKPADAYELELRDDDAREVSEGWRERITDAIKAGGAWAYRDQQGQLVLLYGVVQFSDRLLSPWMLSSPLVSEHGVFVMKEAGRVIKELTDRMPEGAFLGNFISKDSPRNRAFVQSLGFSFYPTPEEGKDVFGLRCR
jgi:hypothetical protein